MPGNMMALGACIIPFEVVQILLWFKRLAILPESPFACAL
jgi:hypothetical protein